MNSLNNIKTATKLFGSFAIICVLLIIVGLIGFTSTKIAMTH